MAEPVATAPQGATTMDLLREGTADLHRKAETQPFQISLVRGTVTREQYADWLSQMHWIHERLERHLLALRQRDARCASLVRDDLLMAPRLTADLRALGVEPGAGPALPSTARFLGWLDATAASDPLALLGVHYVLEGSKNGNSFIARSLAKAWAGQAQARGTMNYLDPHGDAQRPLWQEFKSAMNALELGTSEQARLLDAARATFAAVADLASELV